MNKNIVIKILTTLLILSLITLIACGISDNDRPNEVIGENWIEGQPIDTIQSRFPNQYTVIYQYKIDGCDYIGVVNGNRSDFLTHKGNCSNPIHKTNYKTFFKK